MSLTPSDDQAPAPSGAGRRSSLAKISRTVSRVGLGMVFLAVALTALAFQTDMNQLLLAALAGFAMAALLGLVAVIISLVASRQIDRSAGQLVGLPEARSALRVGGGALLLAIVCVMIIPNFIKPGQLDGHDRGAQQNACINNLRQIDGAKAQWALENKKMAADIPTWNDLIGTDLYIKVTPTCPAGGIYTLESMATKPRCSLKDHTL